jgi:hypothetical protein
LYEERRAEDEDFVAFAKKTWAEEDDLCPDRGDMP